MDQVSYKCHSLKYDHDAGQYSCTTQYMLTRITVFFAFLLSANAAFAACSAPPYAALGQPCGAAQLDGTGTISSYLGTTSTTAASGTDPRIVGALQAARNLSDVASVTTTRTNLGLGSIATQPASAVAITGGTIDGATLGSTAMLNSVSSAILTSNRTITYPSTNPYWLFINGQIVGTWPSGASPVLFSVSDVAANTLGNAGLVNGVQFNHNVNGTTANGSRNTVRTSLTISSISPTDTGLRNYSPITSYAQSNVAVNGAAGDYQQYGGFLFGSNFQATFSGSGATGWNGLAGSEIDLSAGAGSSYGHEQGIAIVHVFNHAVRGKYQSCALCIGDQLTATSSPGWANLIEAPGGTALAADTIGWRVYQQTRPPGPTPTLGTGIDHSAVTFADQALYFPGFTVDPSGTTVPKQLASGAIASVTVGTRGSYLPTDTVTIAVSVPTTGQTAVLKPDLWQVASATIVSGGTGYTNGDVLTLVDVDLGATLTVTGVSGGMITSVSVSADGLSADRQSNPRAVTGGTGTGATFNLSYGLNRAHVQRPGWGYTTAPTLTVSAGTGGTATLTATLGGTTVPVVGAMSVSGSFAETTSSTPASSSAPCTVGQHAWDASYEYRCVSTNSWRRAALSTF